MNRINYAVCICIACTLSNCQSNNPEEKNQTVTAFVKDVSKNQNVEITAPLPVANYQKLFEARATQHFRVSHKTKTVITGKQGLRITIIPGKLQTYDGKPAKEDIEVSLIELTSSMDLFRCNAPTVSNGKLLESGGSYYIGMSSDGEELKLKDGENLMVDLPAVTQTGMQLFYGNRDLNGEMNWEASFTYFQKQNRNAFANYFSNANFEYVAETDKDTAYNQLTKLYKTLDEPAYFYNKKTTIGGVIDTVNKKQPILVIDTVFAWPYKVKELLKIQQLDTNYLTSIYGPKYQYLVRKKSVADAQKRALHRRDSIAKIKMETWKQQTEKERKEEISYYKSAAITSLGWINCDRFYQNEQSELSVDPQYVINSKIDYYFVYKNITGVTKGSLNPQNLSFGLQPINQPVALFAFTKVDGVYYKSKTEFTIKKDNPVKFAFVPVKEKELRKMFGEELDSM